MPELPGDIFIAGIGGMGNAPLALYLAQAGIRVRGWDDRISARGRRLLERAGIDWARPRVDEDARLFAYSSALAEAHPLCRDARERGLPCLRRGELLAEAARGKRLLAVAGSHGKTTTCALLIHFLDTLGFDFSYILGGLFASDQPPPARFSPTASWLVAEIDESDGTIDAFHPELTLVVNLDWDHPDRYPDFAVLEDAFRALFGRTRGPVLLPQCDPNLARLARQAGAEALTFGPHGDYASSRDDHGGTLTLNGRFPGARIALPPGNGFFAHNAAAALAATYHLTRRVAEGAALSFPGVFRRQEMLYDDGSCRVMADYAHHPAEIRALYEHARRRFRGPLTAIFQPHRYTRTRQYAADFARALAGAEEAALLPVYAASEAPLADGTTAAIAEAWPEERRERLFQLQGENDLARWLRNSLVNTSERTVLFIGAGDIDGMARRFADDLRRRGPPRRRETSPATAFLDSIGADVPGTGLRQHVPLGPLTTWRIGGPAAFYAEPTDEQELTRLWRGAHAFGLPVFVLGRGSNVLFPDEGYDGLVLRLCAEAWTGCKALEGARMEAGAGLRLKQLCAEAARCELDGYGFLEGIPGTVGGALRMNAGAMGGWIFDLVESVRFLDAEGTLRELPAEAFDVEYRCCAQLRGAVALSAVFRPAAARAGDAIRREMDTYANKRKASQPRRPSAGSTFKNPPGDYAGRLIEQAGLKGACIGGARVSELHANFIVNEGGATAADVIALMRLTRLRVHECSGVLLEPEVLLAGARWEEVLV